MYLRVFLPPLRDFSKIPNRTEYFSLEDDLAEKAFLQTKSCSFSGEILS